LSRTDTEWHATLRTSNAGVIEGAQELKSEGETCRTLFSAVVAVTAVMLGDAKPSASSPEPAPVRLSEEPAPKPARPVLDSRMSPAGRSDSVMADRAERSDGRAGRRARQFAIGLELLQDFGFA